MPTTKPLLLPSLKPLRSRKSTPIPRRRSLILGKSLSLHLSSSHCLCFLLFGFVFFFKCVGDDSRYNASDHGADAAGDKTLHFSKNSLVRLGRCGLEVL